VKCLGPRERWKSSDLSRRRNSCSNVDDRTSSGRLFQTAGAAAAKARSPIVERCVRHPTSAEVVAERSRCRGPTSDTRNRSADRSAGAVPWRQRYTSTANLNAIRSGTRNQWRLWRSGVMWTCRLAPKIRSYGHVTAPYKLSYYYFMLKADCILQHSNMQSSCTRLSSRVCTCIP